MGMSPEDQALLNSSVANLGQAANVYATVGENKKRRKWQEERYNVLRRDSLADWNMQNEYNSPTSQMARLREAGLNPNLVYGKGADNTAMAVNKPDMDTPQTEAPKIDIGAMQAGGQMALMAGYDVKLKEAQTDNLKTQNTVLLQEQILKAAQTQATLQGTEMSKFDLGQKDRLKDINAQFLEGSVKKQQADIQFTLDANERAAIQSSTSVSEALTRIMKMKAEASKIPMEKEHIRQQIELLKKDNRIKELDARLADQNIRPNENIVQSLIKMLFANGSSKTGVQPGLDALPNFVWPF